MQGNAADRSSNWTLQRLAATLKMVRVREHICGRNRGSNPIDQALIMRGDLTTTLGDSQLLPEQVLQAATAVATYTPKCTETDGHGCITLMATLRDTLLSLAGQLCHVIAHAQVIASFTPWRYEDP